MKINILGSEYKIIETLDYTKFSYLKECDGYHDWSTKELIIKNFINEEQRVGCIRDLKKYRAKVLRHEIIHAFFHESGLWVNSNSLDQWAMNEEMIDWFAIQSPKIIKVYKELGIEK